MNTADTRAAIKTSSDELIANGQEDFGIVDQKGRAIGYKWRLKRVTVELMTEEERAASKSHYLHDTNLPTTYFEVWGTPTRNGNGYGPAFNRNAFAKEEDARKNITKRIANARKSNTKKFSAA